jgi:TPR repeat protein
MSSEFINSVTKYRSVYFHFLDGLLNTTSGGTFNNVIATINDKTRIDLTGIIFYNINHIFQEKSNELKYCIKEKSIIGPIESDRSEIKFLQNDKILFFFDHFNPREYYYDKSFFDNNIKDYVKNLHFCIIPLVFNKHQTTTIIFIKENKLYLFILNTGLDIGYNGESILINEENYYQLTKGIILCDDLNDECKIIEAYKILKDFIFIGFIYKYIKNKSHVFKENTEYKFQYIFPKYLKDLKDIIKNNEKIFLLNNKLINLDQLLSIKLDTLSYNYEKFFDININYYFLVSKFIDLHQKVNIEQICTQDILKYNILSIKDLNHTKQISENFLSKIILYYKNKNFYIKPQESGSCTWYSTYYSIILFFVIHKNYDSYIQFINNINKSFYDYINSIYNKENFKIQLEYDYSYYLYMKKLCSKLIDIKIINNEILDDQQDFIYNIQFNYDKFNYEKVDTMPQKNIYTIVSKYNNNISIINNIIFTLNDINKYHPTIMYIKTAYDIFSIKKFFFKQIDLTSLMINLHKFKINKNINEKLFILLENNLVLYDKTYSLKIEDKIPSYITYFVPIILHIDNITDKTILFDCCLVFFRFFTLLRIIDICNGLLIMQNPDYNPNDKSYKFLVNEVSDEKDYNNEKDREYFIYKKHLFKLIILELVYNNNEKIKIFNKLQKCIIHFNDDINILGIFNSVDKEYNILYNHNINDYNIELLEGFDTYLDTYIKMEEFLYENPDNIKEIFIYLNIHRINEKSETKIKLIRYYCNKVYKKDHTKEIKPWNCLFTLIFNLPYEDNPLFLVKYNGIIKEDFFKEIETIKLEIKSEEEFNDYILNKYNRLNLNLFKIIPEYNKLHKTINNKKYNEVTSKSGIFFELFQSNNLFLIPDNPEENFDIYQIINNGKDYIRYNCQLFILNGNKFYKILKIFVNIYEVLKFKSIIFPFKYLIPNTDLNFIYIKNGIYNIAFNVYKLNKDDCILGVSQLNSDIYNFEINPNTQFFLNKFSLDDKINSSFDNWNSLCCDLQLNAYNILYINLNYKNVDYNGYCCDNNRYSSIFNFNKSNILKENICYKLTNFKLLNKKSDKYLLKFHLDYSLNELTESYKKLLFKISACEINDSNKKEWNENFLNIRSIIECKIKEFTIYIKNFTLGELLNNYEILQSYLLNIKIYNFINKILENIENQDNLCSIIKNYNILFDTKKIPYTYKFEILFELINGNEILKEQMERYTIMINSYKRYSNQKAGGIIPDKLKMNMESLIDIDINDIPEKENNFTICNGKYYQLHHFMMGKGKSAIITPLLSLHLSIIYDQTIFIIVPKHLVNQTRETINDYINILEIKKIFIFSEDDIKKMFLYNEIKKNNTVFLIDEFDSLINPLKSNFNFIKKYDIKVDNISNKIKNIINNIKDKLKIKEKITEDMIRKIINDESIHNIDLFIKNIISIINQINNDLLKYNIMWGIDSNKLYAIPYRSKDNPIENSSFSSCILTIFLTYYYYTIIMDYKIDENILNLTIHNKDLNSLIKLKEEKLTIVNINNYLLSNESLKNEFFDLVFDKIFSNLLLPSKRYNTSFIDILNIDKIFKIGYSGTVNMNLPFLDANYTFNKKCLFKDEDETNNILYAIMNSSILSKNISSIFKIKEEEENEEKINEELYKYDAIIDVCGYFYSILNYNIALKINDILNQKRDIIFINENNEKMVIKNNKLEKLNDYIKYNKPFFYYDQAHIVGIDIKQDNYPILHGLCIVDKNSFYSEVAQAIFRLRKLNLGHRVSFILNNNYDVKDIAELYNKFYCNEINQIEKQNNNMNLQALKSDIRKKRSTNTNIKNYKEKIFYYFNINTLNKDDALELIFTENEIKCIDYLKYNLNKTTISNIIYDINFDSKNIEIQHQADISQQTNSQINSQVISEIETSNNYSKIYSFPFTSYFNKYKFKNFDFIKNIKNIEDYKKYTIQLDDILSYLPNIFINNYDSIIYTFYQKYENESDLIFIYIHTVKKFILIPKYMIIYLYDDFVMYDLNLKIINEQKIVLCNNDQEQILENNIFVKILSNVYTSEEFDDFSSNIKIKNNYYLYLLILYFRILLKKLDKISIINLFISNLDYIRNNLLLHLRNLDLEDNYKKLIRNNIEFKRDIQYTIKNDYLIQKICIFKNKANNNDIIIQKKLGEMYEYGIEVEQNFNESIKYYKLAALNGDLYSQMKIAKIYESGIKISIDYNEAIKFYKLASLNNSLIAQIKLAKIYEKGIIVPQNYNEAIKFYELAQDSNQYNFDDNSYDSLDENIFVERNIWIEITLKLAMMYKKGKVIKKNINKAIYYYEKIKTYYNSISYYGIGEIDYILGKLYYKIDNIDKAINYFYIAVEQNHIKAMNKLGNIYINNKLNYELAQYYYLLAIEKGNDIKSMCYLADLYLTNNFFNIDQAEKYSEMAAELDSDCGLRYLILCYYIRKNIADDLFYVFSLKQVNYFKKAAFKKYDLACKMLAYSYINLEAEDPEYKEVIIYNQLVHELNLILKQNGSTNLYKSDIDIQYAQSAIFYELSDNKKVELCKLYEKKINEHLKRPVETFISEYNIDEVYKKGIDKKLIEITINIILANMDDKIAQRKLGDFYMEYKLFNKAICYYKQAGDKDDIISLIKLGEIYENGIYIDKDKDKAIFYYELVADKGDITIFKKLLKLYDNLDRKNFKYFELASDNNDTYAQIKLGKYYMNYDFSGYHKGLYYYKLASKNGDNLANYLLGEYYKHNYNKVKALKYYKIAADNGNIEALKKYIEVLKYPLRLNFYDDAENSDFLTNDLLSEHYKHNFNEEKILKCYKLDTENGNIEALKKYIEVLRYLGSINFLIDTEENRAMGSYYYKIAGEYGDIESLKYLGSINLSSDNEENRAIGSCYYKRAGENGDAESYYILGNFYNNIQYKNSYNVEEAQKYYKLAAVMNSNFTQFRPDIDENMYD